MQACNKTVITEAHLYIIMRLEHLVQTVHTNVDIKNLDKEMVIRKHELEILKMLNKLSRLYISL